MTNGLSNLVKKEIKEMLRDPKIILGMVLMPLIIFPVMGAAINISTTAVEESMKKMSMALMNVDHGPMANNLVATFNALNVTLVEINASTVDEALESLQESNVTTLIVIPRGFSQNLTSGQRAELEIYTVLRSLSFSEGAKASVAEAPIHVYEQLLVHQAVKQAFPNRDPQAVLDPITTNSFAVFKGRLIEAPPDVLRGLFMSQSFGFPMVIMLLLISAMQIAATSISIEKEEKTLETLLTLPVSRLGILAAKLAGSVVVAAAGAAAALVGVNYYVGSAFSFMPTGSLEISGLTPSPTGYILLGIVMFLTIVSALALAICIAAFSENVRDAQSLVGPLNFVIVLPSLILMFADVEILPFALQAILYAIPYTHAILAFKAAFTADYFIMLRSIGYITVFTVVVLYIAARIFTTEKIVTARIRFRKPRKKVLDLVEAAAT